MEAWSEEKLERLINTVPSCGDGEYGPCSFRSRWSSWSRRRTPNCGRDILAIVVAWIVFVSFLWLPTMQIVLIGGAFCLAAPLGKRFTAADDARSLQRL